MTRRKREQRINAFNFWMGYLSTGALLFICGYLYGAYACV